MGKNCQSDRNQRHTRSHEIRDGFADGRVGDFGGVVDQEPIGVQVAEQGVDGEVGLVGGGVEFVLVGRADKGVRTLFGPEKSPDLFDGPF